MAACDNIDFFSVRVPYISQMTRKLRWRGYKVNTIGDFLAIPVADLVKIGVSRLTLERISDFLKQHYDVDYPLPPRKRTNEDIVNTWQAALDAE